MSSMCNMFVSSLVSHHLGLGGTEVISIDPSMMIMMIIMIIMIIIIIMDGLMDITSVPPRPKW